MVFVSALETAKKYVPEMRKVADVVVVTYHGGFECDLSCGDPTELLTGENEGYAIATQVEEFGCVSDRSPNTVIKIKSEWRAKVFNRDSRGAYVGENQPEGKK